MNMHKTAQSELVAALYRGEGSRVAAMHPGVVSLER